VINKLWIGCLVLFLVACGGGGGVDRKAPPSASKSAAELQVTAQREVEIEGGRILSLSPDGQWLAVEKAKTLCVYQAESLTEQICTPLEGRSLDLHSVAWSPDSQQIAFTENFPVYLHESDLWLMLVETGELNNLTDDGVDRYQLGGEGMDKALIDLKPTWSPDGKTLLFARSTQSGGAWQGTSLYRVPAKGGDAQQVLSVTDEEPAVVWHSLMWSADGKKIFYTLASHDPDTPDNGVWQAEADGDNPERLLGVTNQDMGLPFLLDVSARGDQALIWYYPAAMQFGAQPNVSFFKLLDLKTGSLEPLKRATSEEVEFFGILNATLSPDGSKILYIYKPAQGAYRLVVRDLDSEEENVLVEFEEPRGITREFGMGLDWVEDDTIFVAGGSGFEGLLLSLSTE